MMQTPLVALALGVMTPQAGLIAHVGVRLCGVRRQPLRGILRNCGICHYLHRSRRPRLRTHQRSEPNQNRADPPCLPPESCELVAHNSPSRRLDLPDWPMTSSLPIARRVPPTDKTLTIGQTERHEDARRSLSDNARRGRRASSGTRPGLSQPATARSGAAWSAARSWQAVGALIEGSVTDRLARAHKSRLMSRAFLPSASRTTCRRTSALERSRGRRGMPLGRGTSENADVMWPNASWMPGVRAADSPRGVALWHVVPTSHARTCGRFDHPPLSAEQGRGRASDRVAPGPHAW